MTEGLRIGVVGLPGSWSTEALADALEERTSFRLVIDLDLVSADLAQEAAWYRPPDGAPVDLRTLDGLIVKKVASSYSPWMLDRLHLLGWIAAAGVKVHSPPGAIASLVDRVGCTYALREAGIPMPPTTITENIRAAVEAVKTYGEAVVKPLFSTKARGMTVLSAHTSYDDELAATLEQYRADHGPVLYIQKKLPTLDRDLGVVFLGDEYLGTYARVRKDPGAWNTTTQAGGKYEAHAASPEIIALARRAGRRFGLTFTSVDVAETATGPVVFEVSAFGGFRGLRDALGIDAPALYADHVIADVRGSKPAPPPEPRGILGPSVPELGRWFRAAFPPTEVLDLRFGDCPIRVASNEPKLRALLSRYFRACTAEADEPAIRVDALQMDPPVFDVDWLDWKRDPGKVGRKDTFADVRGGRLLRKVRTGMQYLMSEDDDVILGDCLSNDNQVVNFVIARYISRLLNRDWALCHAAAVSSNGRGAGISATSGAGKSTLALHLLSSGLDFVSNDRLLVRRTEGGAEMAGVPKMPRVNPGTLLNNDDLAGILTKQREEELRSMPIGELWALEEKYDVDVEDRFGEGRWSLTAPLDAFFVLNWSRTSEEPVAFTPVNLAERRDLLPLVMKPGGPFHAPEDGPRPVVPEVTADPYLEIFDGVLVYEVTGGIDFVEGVRRVREILGS